MNRLAAYCLAGLLVLPRPVLLGAAPDVIPLTLPSGKVLQVEVMVKDEDRAMGLMFRPSAPRTAACSSSSRPPTSTASG